MNLIEEIKQLKAERNAVILAHNYVRPELQEIADFTGDSLELSIKAKNVKAETIVFCGVRFMAETAKLLSPDSVVLLPNPDAGCPMADMAAADAVAAYRAAHPEAFLVAYVNTTADVKAHVDLCCTSGNAEKIIAELPENQEILFLPDRNLGGNMNRKLDRKMDLWPGCCPTHDHVTPEMIAEARAAHPGAKVLVHPECAPEVVAAADEALSTGGILKFVRESFDKAFIIGTESGILHRLRKENPGKEFYPLQPEMICPDMKKITLENVRDCLKNMAPRIELPEEILREAVKPIEAMIARS
ncbi:quinolinate synthase NadA [uncultured Victivallis sp.]|uniref:quinolinate synthase NadA n=1 Tax=uncultured Victivallis sp. TaxID=354118 RepID=UPI0025FE389D|nr:quinolinate synthase NadA [uncultured Victivallis sp.]